MTGKRTSPAKPKSGHGPGRRPGKRKLPETFAAHPPSTSPAARAFGALEVVKIGERHLSVTVARSVDDPEYDHEAVFREISDLVDALLSAADQEGNHLSERAAIRLALLNMPDDWQNEKIENRIRVWRSPSQRKARDKRK